MAWAKLGLLRESCAREKAAINTSQEFQTKEFMEIFKVHE